MAEQQGEQHRLPQVPAVAAHHHRRQHHGRVPGGVRRRVLPQHLPHAALPRRHVPGHCRSDRVHHIRLRCHRQGVRSEGDEPRLLGVLS